MSDSQHSMKTIPLDDFSERLLKVMYELFRVEALRKKVEFYGKLPITASNFSKVESNYRNFPNEPDKRSQAILALHEHFGVNPMYMKGKSDKMFLRQPEKKAAVPPEEVVKLNFDNKKQKQQVLDELNDYKSKYEQLLQENAMLKEALSEYKTKTEQQSANPDTDNTTDKP